MLTGILCPASNYNLNVAEDGSDVTITFNEETHAVAANVVVTNAISTVAAEAAATVSYNIAGQRLTNGYKGLVISNRKKTIKR